MLEHYIGNVNPVCILQDVAKCISGEMRSKFGGCGKGRRLPVAEQTTWSVSFNGEINVAVRAHRRSFQKQEPGGGRAASGSSGLGDPPPLLPLLSVLEAGTGGTGRRSPALRPEEPAVPKEPAVSEVCCCCCCCWARPACPTFCLTWRCCFLAWWCCAHRHSYLPCSSILNASTLLKQLAIFA